MEIDGHQLRQACQIGGERVAGEEYLEINYMRMGGLSA